MKKILGCMVLFVALFSCASNAVAGGSSDSDVAPVAPQPVSKPEPVVTVKEKEVNFNSESGSLTISNATSEDVVVFVGKVEKGNILGGIRGNQSRTFNLSRVSGIPSNGSLLIRVATFETYNKKASITENDVIYTGLVVYDLNDSGDRINLSIYKGVDSSHQKSIYVSNESEHYVLELRIENAAQGDIIATLPPLQTNKRIYLTPRDDGFPYDFYASYVYVNPKTGEKTSMNSGKEDRKRAIPESPGGEITPLRFPVPSASNVGYDVAFVSVQNDTSSGIEFRNGETTLKNQKGIRFTASGRTDVYEIASKHGENGQTYTALKFEFDDFSKKTIAPYVFKPGYKYELVITDMNGNYEYDIREVGIKSLVEDARIELFNEN